MQAHVRPGEENMLIENVCTKKTYLKNGEEKTLWLNVGSFKTTDDGKRFLELNMFPNTPFYIFERKENDAGHSSNRDLLNQETPF